MKKGRSFIRDKMSDGSHPSKAVEDALGSVSQENVRAYLQATRDELFFKIEDPHAYGAILHDIRVLERLLTKLGGCHV